MEIKECAIEGLLLIRPIVHVDLRGFFLEAYNEREWKEKGLGMTFVQDNLSLSKKGTLRGLHFQKKHPQGKLITVLEGEIFDVALDLRKQSKTFGKFETFLLSSQSRQMLYIPEGFAHGFLSLSETSLIHYKSTDFYYPGDEGSIRFDDPSLAIPWPLTKKEGKICLSEDEDGLILSEKDAKAPSFEQFCKDLGIR